MARRDVSELDQLKASWNLAGGQKKKAEIEEMMRAAMGYRSPGGQVRDRAADFLGAPRADVIKRQCLFRAGAAAEPIWEALDGGMLLATALRIYREARGKDFRPPTLGAVRDALEVNFAQKTIECSSKSGKKFFRSPRKPKSAIKARVSKASIRDRTRIRSAIAMWMDRELKDVEPIERERLKGEFAAEAAAMVDIWGKRIARAAQRGLIGLGVAAAFASHARRKAIAASKVLSMDPPAVGKPVDIARAKRQVRALARLYHPDAVGSDEKVDLFNEVMGALRALEEYNEQFEKKGESNGIAAERVASEPGGANV
jgi:hypothetical protein